MKIVIRRDQNNMHWDHCRTELVKFQATPLSPCTCIVSAEWPQKSWSKLRRNIIDASNKTLMRGLAH